MFSSTSSLQADDLVVLDSEARVLGELALLGVPVPREPPEGAFKAWKRGVPRRDPHGNVWEINGELMEISVR